MNRGEVASRPMMDAKEVADAVLRMAARPLLTSAQLLNLIVTKMPFGSDG